MREWILLALDAAIWPFERLLWALRERVFWPLQDLLSSPTASQARVPRLVTVGAIGAVALGALVTGALVASGSDEATGDPGAPLVAEATQPDPEPEPEDITPILAKTEPQPDGPVLKGVRPRFGAKSEKERAAARAALRELRAKQAAGADQETGAGEKVAARGEEQSSPAKDQDEKDDGAGQTEQTGDDTEAASAETVDPTSGASASNATAEEKRRKESALSVAERFAIAFVSYEVGTTGRPVNRVFRDTTRKDLFDALRTRPPRQPAGGKVPKARVMNVVGGPRKKKTIEVSVGLLRVDGVTELRLELEKSDRGWVVKTVRG